MLRTAGAIRARSAAPRSARREEQKPYQPNKSTNPDGRGGPSQGSGCPVDRLHETQDGNSASNDGNGADLATAMRFGRRRDERLEPIKTRHASRSNQTHRAPRRLRSAWRMPIAATTRPAVKIKVAKPL